MSDLFGYLEAHQKRFLDELGELIRIPSVSADPEHAPDVSRAAEWLAGHARSIGLDAEVMPTAGHPAVIAEWRGAEGAPTVLVYGHYDVQPVDPIDEWASPPFEATLRDGRIYARGATDDKGQLFAHMKAIEAHLATSGRLPVNIVLLIEGEEEISSPALMPFVSEHAERLAADVVVISDSPFIEPGLPTISASLRGTVAFDVRVEGPCQDLHSGSFGGAVLNPATVLSRLLATLHDSDWRVAVDGFYDRVDDGGELRSLSAAIPFDEDAFRAEAGTSRLDGEAGFSTLERVWTRPTLEVNGLVSGYSGEGTKTIVPARAHAKLGCRLVPDQDPEDIAELVGRHLRRAAPDGVRVSVESFGKSRPWRAGLSHPAFEAAGRAMEAAFGRPPVFAGNGGSIGLVPEMSDVLGAPILLMGFGSPGENAHAPNEWLSLDQFSKGIKASSVLLSELSGGGEPGLQMVEEGWR